MSTAPASGLKAVDNIRNAVVLPAPLGPNKPKYLALVTIKADVLQGVKNLAIFTRIFVLATRLFFISLDRKAFTQIFN